MSRGVVSMLSARSARSTPQQPPWGGDPRHAWYEGVLARSHGLVCVWGGGGATPCDTSPPPPPGVWGCPFVTATPAPPPGQQGVSSTCDVAQHEHPLPGPLVAHASPFCCPSAGRPFLKRRGVSPMLQAQTEHTEGSSLGIPRRLPTAVLRQPRLRRVADNCRRMGLHAGCSKPNCRAPASSLETLLILLPPSSQHIKCQPCMWGSICLTPCSPTHSLLFTPILPPSTRGISIICKPFSPRHRTFFNWKKKQLVCPVVSQICTYWPLRFHQEFYMFSLITRISRHPQFCSF